MLGAYDPLSGDNSYGTRINMYFPYDTDEMISSSGTFDTGRRGIARYKAFASNTEVITPGITCTKEWSGPISASRTSRRWRYTPAAPAPTRRLSTASTAKP
ncbi:hypothetical protein [Hymenobacter jejuensis]|uniref:hypothetical protein n=1 Tax=Hymenobacter jejuensis TaxID=2502781 RepID=UPI001E4AD760|nr:hypothetical protein [Hymenobacter jejuensis]